MVFKAFMPFLLGGFAAGLIFGVSLLLLGRPPGVLAWGGGAIATIVLGDRYDWLRPFV